MDDVRTDKPVRLRWLRRNIRPVLMVLPVAAIVLLSLASNLFGLTTYVIFLSVLLAATVARLLGKLLRLPEFGTGFECGGMVMLLVFAGVVWLALYALRNPFANLPDDMAECLLAAGGLVLCGSWIYHAVRVARFWPQLALATGMSLGVFATFLWAIVLIGEPNHIPWEVTATALAPLGVLVLWLACRSAWRLLRSFRGRVNGALPASCDSDVAAPADKSRAKVAGYFAWPAKRQTSHPFQFTLRSMLLVMLATGILLGWLRTIYNQIQRHEAAIERLHRSNSVHMYVDRYCGKPGDPYWIVRLFETEARSTASIVLTRKDTTNEDLLCLEQIRNEIDLTLEGGFTDDSLQHVGRARNVRRLYLSGNPVTSDGLEHLEDLTSLTTLDLSETAVTDAGLKHLVSLPKLLELNLSGNQSITDAGMIHLARSPVWQLDLTNTRITHAGLRHLCKAPHLHMLNLTNTAVTDAALTCLRDMPYLTSLDLTGTKITDAGLSHLTGMRELGELRLDKTGITDAGLAHLQGMDELWILSLCDTRITDAGLAHLAGLKSLQELNLRNTRITDAGLAHLANLRKLDTLNLRGTQLTGVGLVHLAKPEFECGIDLRDTKATRETIQQLEQQLPDCYIEGP